MKTKFFAFLVSLSLFLFLCNSCHQGNSMIVNNGDYRLAVHYDGDIEIADDETDFESISPHGFVKYSKKGYRMYAEGNNHGDIQYELSISGHDVDPNSQEGKTLIAMAIKDMLELGFDAEGRIQRLYNKGGKKALMGELSRLNSDYIKRLYLEWLLENTDLSTDELKTVASNIENRIGSDYDKSVLLTNYSDKYFDDSASTNAWLAAVASIGSDYDKANAMKKFMEQSSPKADMQKALQITSSVGSDYDKSTILETAIEHNSYNQADYKDLLDAINKVGSSYNKKELLKKLIQDEIPGGDDFNYLLKSINKIESDYEKHEVLSELTTKNIASDDQWRGIMMEASKVNSEYDRAEVLIDCARHMPRNDSLHNAFMDAANSIKSENDYGRVMQGWRQQ